jgi:hypothetical protein
MVDKAKMLIYKMKGKRKAGRKIKYPDTTRFVGKKFNKIPNRL